jgi:sensor histidine kinase YesM
MVLVRQRQLEQAEETLARFADLLRLVLDDVDASEGSLRRELDYVQRYLAIEQLRFADRLRIELEVEPGLLGAAVPSLALQPLVENAVRHGIARKASAGLVRVVARRQGELLRLEVQDDGPGPGCGAGGAGGAGIGLANTRARLRQLYGDAAELTLQPAPGGGALVSMTLPLREVAELGG